MAERPTLYLIDGSSYIYRAYYAIRHLSSPKGFPTNALYGFIQMLLKVVKDRKERVAFLKERAGVSVFDAKLDDLLPKPSKKVRDGIAGFGQVIEFGSAQAAQLGDRDKTHCRFDDHSQRSFGSHHETFQGVSRSSNARTRPESEMVAVGHDDFLGQDRVAGARDLGATPEALRVRVLRLEPAPVGEVLHALLPVLRPDVPARDGVLVPDLLAEPPRPRVLLPRERLELRHAHPERRAGRQGPGALRPVRSAQVPRDTRHDHARRDRDEREVERP